MGILDRLGEVLGRSIHELGGTEDGGALLSQALAELEKEATHAQGALAEAQGAAHSTASLAASRLQEEEMLLARARTARERGMKQEAARLEDAASRAHSHAQSLKEEAAASANRAQALGAAVSGLRKAVADVAIRQQELAAYLGTVRASRPAAHVHAPRPPPPAPDPMDPHAHRRRVERDLEDLETRTTVEERLAELKKRARR